MAASQQIAIRNKIVGILVKQVRTRSGISRRECAELLGCSPEAFAQYEQGELGLSLPQIEALAYLLGVPPASLWDDEHGSTAPGRQEAVPMGQIMALRRKMVAIEFRKCRASSGLTTAEAASLLACTPETIPEFESGKADIPLAALEIAAGWCGKALGDLVDEETPLLSKAQQEREILARLEELPADVRDFVLRPTNALYLRIAMLLSAMKADSLRQIAETLLDITY
ncbi:MAG: helix-turn-helix domain-containing protein [Anaerolineae bacterium]|nr:helix-turn-helix domain-containing protein [Anaerolineae bacterium]